METQSKDKPIIKYTPDGERIEISSYIWSVMHGAPPRYLEDEDLAIEIAKKLGWKADPRYYVSLPPISDEEDEANRRFLKACGVDVDEMDQIMEEGGGTIPVGYIRKKN